MNWTDLISRFWNSIPNGLKKFVGYGLASGLALTIVLAAWLFWGTGYIQEKLNIPTRDLMRQEQDRVSNMNDAELHKAIMLTVQLAMDSARATNDSLFDTMVRDVIEPGIEKQNRLYRQVERLSKLVGDNNSLLEEQTARTSSSIDQLRDQVLNKDDGRAVMGEILDEMRSNRERDEMIMKKLRIKYEF